MSAEIVVLRLLHILSAVFWAGGVMYATFFVLPSIAEAGPAGGAVMAGMQRRKIMVVLPVVSLTTILTGLRLLQVLSNGFSAEYFQTAMGETILVVAVATIVAFLIGFLVVRPSMTRVMALMARRDKVTPDERLGIDVEAGVLRGRARIANTAVAFILIIATALMAVARYL